MPAKKIIWPALLVLPVAAWLACTDLWLPPKASTISLWYAASTFDQCSRTAPQPGEVFWIPSAAQVREIEAALPPMFAARKRQGLTVPQESDAVQPFSYQHQYIGFVQNGERLIYVNASPVYDRAGLDEREFSLLEKPEVMCDGGRFFWGVVYHPHSKTFEAPAFNGR